MSKADGLDSVQRNPQSKADNCDEQFSAPVELIPPIDLRSLEFCRFWGPASQTRVNMYLTLQERLKENCDKWNMQLKVE
jgi:hypothetical protein